jgi:hypothetical protein
VGVRLSRAVECRETGRVTSKWKTRRRRRLICHPTFTPHHQVPLSLACVRTAVWLPRRQTRHARFGTSKRRKCWPKSRGIDSIAHIEKYHNQQRNHTTTMKAPSTALLRTFSPLWRSEAPLATVRGCMAQQQQQRADFSSTPTNQARDKKNKKDPRISMRARDRFGYIIKWR